MNTHEPSAQMTNAEKALFLQGTDFMYTRGLGRLGLPRLSMADGPHGVRKQIGGGDNGVAASEPATAFPTAACIASSWDPEIAARIGRAIGEECRAHGVHLLLGPGVNIKRNPLCGRNFEYYSEDPLLSGKMGAAFVRGVQENGVCACVKHFALNNQENTRFSGNSVADERAVREIYLRSFERVIREGRPGAVMTAYNRINGVFASENPWLLTEVLRGEWGFDGIVMSDWGGTHDRVAGISAGEDLEMPGDTAVSVKRVYDALCDGSLPAEKADACIRHIVAVTDRFACPPKAADFDRRAHTALAADAATESAVLMKNDGLLPLDPKKPLCVIGELFARMRYQGSGSSMISPTETIGHREAFDRRGIRYIYARGYAAGTEEPTGDLIGEAVAAAAEYDTVLLYLGLTDLDESEGGDRPHMRLPQEQLELVRALVAAKKRIAVVLSGGSPTEMPFIGDVSAVLNLCLPGQAGGEAGARLLFGEANPAGRLAETWYASYADVPYGDEYGHRMNELYKESIYVGYRHAETAGIRPAFPFGFGLSYTTFSYDALRVTQTDDAVTAAVTIRNTGSRAGAEVVQVYVGKAGQSAVFRPVRELRAFQKLRLAAGEEKTALLTFSLSDLAFWDRKAGGWTTENGEYLLQVGASSADIRLTAPLTVTAGVQAVCPYPAAVNRAMEGAAVIDDETFSALLDAPLPPEPPVLPLTMESRLCDYRHTGAGRLLYAVACAYAGQRLKRAQKLPAGAERDNRVKGAVFLQRIFDTNCLRTLSLSAGRQLPWHIAEGLVCLGNGKWLRGIAVMCRPHTLKKPRGHLKVHKKK